MDLIAMALRSWHDLNKMIAALDESQVTEALDRELKHGRRQDIAVRLHQRLSSLRTTREREELIQKLKGE